MPQHLYNTLARRLERFEPADPARILFYSCGPTVYDYAHIGNFRSFLVADTLRRWLESPLCSVAGPGGADHAGPRTVVQVMNITDVGHMTEDDLADGGGEDKMEAAASRLREAKKKGTLPPGVDVDPADPYAIAAFYIDAFKEDGARLGLRVVEDAKRDPTLLPRATEHVKAMLEIVTDLVAKGLAYQTAHGAVYFDTQAYNAKGGNYGALSGNTIDAIRSGAGGRVGDTAQAEKKHPADFLLWKADRTHLMRWDPSALLGRTVALGEGYPGWHIECSAMALERLRPDGGVIDLHSGGEDNIFPHHECEIAQSRSYSGADSFARCWVHTRFLLVEGEKMSKSTGNFFTLRDLLAKGFSPGAIRLELVRTHYRSNANFTEQGLRDSQRMLEKWRRFQKLALFGGSGKLEDMHEEQNVLAVGSISQRRVREKFSTAMHDDLNTAGAIGAINSWIRETPNPTPSDISLLHQFDKVLGVLNLMHSMIRAEAPDPDAPKIESLIEARAAARKSKNFAEADRIKAELIAMGVDLTDTPQGTTWSRKASL